MESKNIAALSDVLSDALAKTRRVAIEYNKWVGSDAAKLDRLAVVYGQLREVSDQLDEFKKEFNELITKISNVDLVAAFRTNGTTKIGNEHGTIYLTDRFSASVQDREIAFKWLEENELGDLIQPAVNPSTLTAALKRFVDETGKEPDPEVIKVSRHTMAAFKRK